MIWMSPDVVRSERGVSYREQLNLRAEAGAEEQTWPGIRHPKYHRSHPGTTLLPCPKALVVTLVEYKALLTRTFENVGANRIWR